MEQQSKDQTVLRKSLWRVFAGISLIFLITSCSPSEEDKAMAEWEAENKQLADERKAKAAALREEVLSHKWDHLFKKEHGVPTKIQIDEKGGVIAYGVNIDLRGTTMINGTKFEFSIDFKRRDDKWTQDGFYITEWEEYVPPSKSNGDMHGAWAYMQLFVEKELKNPKGAKFIGYARNTVKSLGGNKYRVTAEVDASNGFGATVRTPFTGVIEDVGGKWKLHELQIGN